MPAYVPPLILAAIAFGMAALIRWALEVEDAPAGKYPDRGE